MADKLNLVVTDCGADLDCAATTDNSAKYTGTLAAMGTNVALSNYAAGAARKYEFSVQFDASADNLYQGDNSVAEFTWNAA